MWPYEIKFVLHSCMPISFRRCHDIDERSKTAVFNCQIRDRTRAGKCDRPTYIMKRRVFRLPCTRSLASLTKERWMILERRRRNGDQVRSMVVIIFYRSSGGGWRGTGQRMFQGRQEENEGVADSRLKIYGLASLMETHVLWMIETSMQQHPTSLRMNGENSRGPAGWFRNVSPS